MWCGVLVMKWWFVCCVWGFGILGVGFKRLGGFETLDENMMGGVF